MSSTEQAGQGLAARSWRVRYTSSEHDLVRDFFAPALAAATTYHRAVAYFRSSFYTLTSQPVAAFAVRGGHIRLLCSPDLSEADLGAIQEGDASDDLLRAAALRELRRIEEMPAGAEGMAVFRALISSGCIDVRIALMRSGDGIFHDKVGILTDADGNAITFVGSANETWSAWSGYANHESFEVFRSWAGDTERVTEHQDFFDRAWAGQIDSIRVVQATEAIREGLMSTSPDIDPMAVLREAAEAPPRSPVDRVALFPHQAAALAAWEAGGRRGVFQHATGSGKTITALEAIRGHISAGYPALVLVPSVLLLEQWNEEASRYLQPEDPTVLVCGGGHDRWRTPGLLTSHLANSGSIGRVTLSTLQTAISEPFLRAVHDHPNLLVVCDEVHRFGAPGYIPLDGLPEGPRLGLSATPARFRDPEGTERIRESFGPVLEPVVTLRDAIEWGRLVPYEYRFETAGLNEDEVDQWHAFTDRIARALGGVPDLSSVPPHVRTLLIQRSRIGKKAAAKVSLAASIVGRYFREGQHWLVYCEDSEQLANVRDALRVAGIPSLEYRSEMDSDHATVLDRFVRLGGVLVSIRCLDEGVDIPAVSHAVILASSQNPREYIQRRGRVLRVHPGKQRAHIFDVLVLPPVDQHERFKSLVLAEVMRAHEFAKDAQNKSAALGLERLAIEWGIDFGTFDLTEVSDESEEGANE